MKGETHTYEDYDNNNEKIHLMVMTLPLATASITSSALLRLSWLSDNFLILQRQTYAGASWSPHFIEKEINMGSVMEKKFIDVLNCDDNVVTVSSLNNKELYF